jgi:hypothetical protein
MSPRKRDEPLLQGLQVFYFIRDPSCHKESLGERLLRRKPSVWC